MHKRAKLLRAVKLRFLSIFCFLGFVVWFQVAFVSSQPSASFSWNVVVKVYEAFTSNKRSNKYIKSYCEPRSPNDLGAEGVRQEPFITNTQHKMLTTYRTKGLYQSLDTSPEFKS